jgi:HAD superfamily hydrolase (TIGR01509 family)
MIEAVIFDIDGVLLDSFEANLKFFQNLMEKAGYPPPTREEFPKIFHLSMMDAIKAMTKSNSQDEIERIWKMGEGRDVDYPVDLLTMPDKAEEVLDQLNNKYKLGIVTSRIENGIYESPKLARFKDYFEVAIAYEHTTNHKPHPEPLLLAAQSLNVKPIHTVYIGDAQSDVIAGKAAGMKVIAYSPIKHEGSDAQTTLFEQIPSIIEKL